MAGVAMWLDSDRASGGWLPCLGHLARWSAARASHEGAHRLEQGRPAPDRDSRGRRVGRTPTEDAVSRDVTEGLVSPDRAADIYGSDTEK